MKKPKKLLALFLPIIILIMIYEIILFTHNSPEAVIRRHLFRYSPGQSLSCHITKTSYVDNIYGQQYTIQGFTDPESGGIISFAYVKKNFLGLYYWSGGGSGP